MAIAFYFRFPSRKDAMSPQNSFKNQSAGVLLDIDGTLIASNDAHALRLGHEH